MKNWKKMEEGLRVILRLNGSPTTIGLHHDLALGDIVDHHGPVIFGEKDRDVDVGPWNRSWNDLYMIHGHGYQIDRG